jgi:hypothetical protein
VNIDIQLLERKIFDGISGGLRHTASPAAGGYVIRVNGFPIYQLGLAIGAILDRLDVEIATRSELVKKLGEARVYLEFAAGKNKLPDGTQSILPADSKGAAQGLVETIDAIIGRADAPELPPLSPTENGALISSLFYLYNILYRDLYWFDLLVAPQAGLHLCGNPPRCNHYLSRNNPRRVYSTHKV